MKQVLQGLNDFGEILAAFEALGRLVLPILHWLQGDSCWLLVWERRS